MSGVEVPDMHCVCVRSAGVKPAAAASGGSAHFVIFIRRLVPFRVVVIVPYLWTERETGTVDSIEEEEEVDSR